MISTPSRSGRTMYLVLLTLTLLAALTVARWFAEPACPACTAKSWVDTPPRLKCAKCGWTNLAVAVAPAPAPAENARRP